MGILSLVSQGSSECQITGESFTVHTTRCRRKSSSQQEGCQFLFDDLKKVQLGFFVWSFMSLRRCHHHVPKPHICSLHLWWGWVRQRFNVLSSFIFCTCPSLASIKCWHGILLNGNAICKPSSCNPEKRRFLQKDVEHDTSKIQRS